MSIGHLYVLFGEMFLQFCSYLNQIVCFLVLNMSSLYVLDISPLLDVSLVNIFFHSVSCLFALLMVSCAAKKFSFDVQQSHLFIFCFPCLRTHIQKHIFKTDIRELSVFFSKSFMVLGLKFESLIHFEFILVYGVRKWSSFIFACICPVSAPLTEKDCLF